MDAEIEYLLADLTEDNERSQNEIDPLNGCPPLVRISKLYSQLQHLYNQRLPVLSERHLTIDQYVKVVMLLKNESDLPIESLESQFTQILGSDNALVIRIFLSTNPLVQLSSEKYEQVENLLADLGTELSEYQTSITQLVESSKTTMPNLSAFIQPRVAAELILKVGSLKQLAVTPPSNLVNPSTSVLVSDPIIAEVPTTQQRQALRILAAKLVLAARADASGVGKVLPQTLRWKASVEKRISKLLAPPPSRQHLSLPKPVDKKNSRRGGLKLRKRKEKQAEQIGKPEIMRFGQIE